MSTGRRFRSPNTKQSTNRNYVQEQQQESLPRYGIYQGEVRRTDDYTRSGYIQVFIDSLAKDPTSNNGLFECRWTSPFAGSTPALAIGKNVEKYEETQKSYGLWMVPPDVGNHVLVAFGDGDVKNPYIVGCLFSDRFNYMVPGMASGKSYSDPDIAVPVAEKNRKDERTTQNDAIRPIAPYLAQSIVEQGLINDPIRGAGTASARREAPSTVFGILTPGPLEENTPGTNTEVRTNRTGGHQFIMDDNPGSRMIRLRTAGGTQIMLDDTTESIYMINKNGKGWVEINKLGEINVYAEGGINFRTKGNFNVRADQNINLEAGQNITVRAAGDNAGGQYLGPNPAAKIGAGPLGVGGFIKFDAAANIEHFAAANYTATAAGGGINLSGANDVIIGSGKNIGLTTSFGNLIFESTLGGVSVTGPAGIGLHAKPGIVGIEGTTVNLNSGPGFLQPCPVVKTTAPSELNDHKDQPSATPEFDTEAALAGKSAVKNAGNRSGRQDTIKTIVGRLITAEPYAGHSQGAKPGFDEPIVGASETATQGLPPAASTQDGKPDDAQTPNGTKAGDTYVDSNGNTVASSPNSPSEASKTNQAKSAIQNAADDAGKTVGRAASAINDGAAKVNAEINKLADAIPTYADIQNAINDFANAVEKKIDEVLGISAFIASIKAQIPPIRFPTTNVIQQKIVAGVKQLKELEFQLKQFSLDKLGLPIDLNIPAIQDMKNQINGVMAQAKDGLDAVNKLKELGIDIVNDAGSLIYRDSLGNTLVDFSNGIGPVASTLAVQSEIAKTYNNVKSAINVPVSNNQAQALAAFAKDIGEENFVNSNVLQALNEGKYNEVPRLMAQWSLGPPIGSTTPTPKSNLVYRQDLRDSRYFQGQVFQSPDNLDVGPPPGTVDGGLSAKELGDIIKARREEFNAANYAGPTEYYGG
jgi:hypothetical protein